MPAATPSHWTTTAAAAVTVPVTAPDSGTAPQQAAMPSWRVALAPTLAPVEDESHFRQHRHAFQRPDSGRTDAVKEWGHDVSVHSTVGGGCACTEGRYGRQHTTTCSNNNIDNDNDNDMGVTAAAVRRRLCGRNRAHSSQ